MKRNGRTKKTLEPSIDFAYTQAHVMMQLRKKMHHKRTAIKMGLVEGIDKRETVL